MKKTFVFLLLSVFLTGCNLAVSNFVEGAKPEEISNPSLQPPGVASSSGPVALKVSTGKVTAVGADYTVDATASATRKRLNGGDISAEVSVGRARSSP